MNVVKPDTINSVGSITRSSIGTYFDSAGVMQTAAINQVRENYDPITKEFLGILIESSATNILLNSSSLSTQSVTTSATEYTLSFYGTGQIVLSGTASATIVGTGAYPVRTKYTFMATAGSLTLTVTGTVQKAQLEVGSKETSWISTNGSTATRAADVISGSGLVYTTVSNLNAEWSSSTTYSLGQVVDYGVYGTYASLQNSNLNKAPNTEVAYWVRTGPTNKMAAFDSEVSTRTTNAGSFTFAVTASSIDTVAILNALGNKVSIAVTDLSNNTLVYHSDQYLDGSNTLDWYTYFFYDVDTLRTQVVFRNVSDVTPALVTIRITSSGIAALGNYVQGSEKIIGTSQYGISAGIIDYSKKETDEFGNTTFVVRAFSKRMSASVHLTNSNINRVQRLLYSLRATPALWIASSDTTFEEPLIVFGFYKDFATEIAYPSHSICNIEIEGLT